MNHNVSKINVCINNVYKSQNSSRRRRNSTGRKAHRNHPFARVTAPPLIGPRRLAIDKSEENRTQDNIEYPSQSRLPKINTNGDTPFVDYAVARSVLCRGKVAHSKSST